MPSAFRSASKKGEMTSFVPVLCQRKRALYIGSFALCVMIMHVIITFHSLSSLALLSRRIPLLSATIEESLCSKRSCDKISFALHMGHMAQRGGQRSSEQYVVSRGQDEINQDESLRNSFHFEREEWSSAGPFRLPLRQEDNGRKSQETTGERNVTSSQATGERHSLEPPVGQTTSNTSAREQQQAATRPGIVTAESGESRHYNGNNESSEKKIPEVFGNVRIMRRKTRKASKRAKWLRQNWEKFGILRSDDLSRMFATRMRAFLDGSGYENLTELQLMSGKSSSSEGRQESCPVRFFITWISNLGLFGPRERLCLESVFRTHPSACVVILSRSFDSESGRRLLRPLVEKGFRVTAITPDIPFLLRDTPAQRWFGDLQQGRIDPGKISLSQNLSNLLRLAVLYKYGGIYIDTDMILLRNVESLVNALGAQEEEARGGGWTRLNNAAMAFERGHPLVKGFLREFATTFNGNKWGHNGPYLVTRVARRAMKGVQNWRVLRAEALYAVNWRRIQEVFRADAREEVLERLKNSLAIHLWNRQSRRFAGEAGSAFDGLLRRACVLCDAATLAAALRPQPSHALARASAL